MSRPLVTWLVSRFGMSGPLFGPLVKEPSSLFLEAFDIFKFSLFTRLFDVTFNFWNAPFIAGVNSSTVFSLLIESGVCGSWLSWRCSDTPGYRFDADINREPESVIDLIPSDRPRFANISELSFTFGGEDWIGIGSDISNSGFIRGVSRVVSPLGIARNRLRSVTDVREISRTGADVSICWSGPELSCCCRGSGADSDIFETWTDLFESWLNFGSILFESDSDLFVSASSVRPSWCPPFELFRINSK